MATPNVLRRYLFDWDAARKARDIPKRDRPRRTVDPTRPMADSVATLGHPARGRKKGRR